PIGYLTLAASAVEGASETNYYRRTIDPALLRTGTNVMAVEVHQNDPASADLNFDLALLANLRLQPPNVSFTSPGAFDFALTAQDSTGRWYDEQIIFEGGPIRVCVDAEDSDGA